MNRSCTAALTLGLLVGLVTLGAPEPADAQGAKARSVGVQIDGNVEYPQLSPDGTQIAFEVNFPAEKRRELYIVGWDGRAITAEAQKLVPESMGAPSRYGASKRVTHGFSWANTGGYAYAYTVSDSSGAQDIYIDNWSEMVEEGNSANKNPAWDPSEPRFVFSSGRTGNGDLYLWDQGPVMQLTFDEANAELFPVWDATGDKVAFVRAGKAGSHIYLLDVAMFTSQALVQFSGTESTRPSFSPDGKKVAFFSNKGHESATSFGLWVTDARPGGTPRQIGPKVRLPSKGAAYWTPDGKGVIAVKDSPDEGDPICIFPVDGGSANCLLGAGTRNNRDPQLRVVGSTWKLLYTAQQASSSSEGTWQQMYAYDIPR
jgi:Tol biopolymer transport system component